LKRILQPGQPSLHPLGSSIRPVAKPDHVPTMTRENADNDARKRRQCCAPSGDDDGPPVPISGLPEIGS
jgi:hypothetical protein